MTHTYNGFSFKNWQRTKSFKLSDVDLVKQDLFNHIFTRKGDRVGLRGFGTNIQDLIFEPFDDETIVLINDQVRGVIAFDPRVVLLSEDDYVMVADYEKRIMGIDARLFYVELNLTDVLHLNITFES
jgi:phage baseplate assembly protein W